MHTSIETTKLNDIDPQTWLADVLTRPLARSPRKEDQRTPAKELAPAAPARCSARACAAQPLGGNGTIMDTFLRYWTYASP